MKITGEKIISRFRKRWQLLRFLEVALYASGAATLTYFVTLTWIYAILIFIVAFAIATIVFNPRKINSAKVISYFDQKLSRVEFSTGLLLQPDQDLSDLARLQRHKVLGHLSREAQHIYPPNHLKKAVIVVVTCLLLGVAIQQVGFNIDNFKRKTEKAEIKEKLAFQPADTSQVTDSQVTAVKVQKVYINYPKYTGLRSVSTEDMNIKAVEGSTVSWTVGFDGTVKKVIMEGGDNAHDMQYSDGQYHKSVKLQESGFYNFRFFDQQGRAYVSPVYKIEVVRDSKPVISIEGLEQFTSFEHNDDKRINLKAAITDDFGVAQAYIIATVSKGTGESVKFREEKLAFDAGFSAASRSLTLQKSINLDGMQMTPGDELYFYVEAVDNMQPQANVVRSETYFAVVKDTATYEFSLEGSLGVDLMPEYFRSQRQLIIDTEKLIRNKPKISKKVFNSTSNELGFDQKALRLKYGQFMGEESESGIAISEDEAEAVHEGDHEGGEDPDPLAEYMHDHDGDNEHNLVAEEHEHEEDDEEDPLHEYVHSHDEPEEATLYTASIRGKLRQAMNEMWDAELYLRLFQPEKSLPYQYKALKLIQEIKNHARIYVHRIGFDPPPIKEEKRLTGNISEVTSEVDKQDFDNENPYPYLLRALERVEELINTPAPVTPADKALFDQAGKELAGIAIENPGRYLEALEYLKKLSGEAIAENEQRSMLLVIQKAIRSALPEKPANPGLVKQVSGELDQLFLEELERLQND